MIDIAIHVTFDPVGLGTSAPEFTSKICDGETWFVHLYFSGLDKKLQS